MPLRHLPSSSRSVCCVVCCLPAWLAVTAATQMSSEQAADYCKRKANYTQKQQQGVQKVRVVVVVALRATLSVCTLA